MLAMIVPSDVKANDLSQQVLSADTISVQEDLMQARRNFIQGNYDAAREYALRAKNEGSSEASLLLGQIDFKVLLQQVDNGTATESSFAYFKSKYKGTSFEAQAESLYQEWKEADTEYDNNTSTSSASTRSTYGSDGSNSYSHTSGYSSSTTRSNNYGYTSSSTPTYMHFNRKAYEREHYGPMLRVGLAGDIAAGTNCSYGGGLNFRLGRSNSAVNLLFGAEFNVLSHFGLYYDAYDDEYYIDDCPYLRTRRLNIPVELQFKLKSNDKGGRFYLGLGMDYQYNFYGRLIDNEYRMNINYDKLIRKHTFDVRASLGYSWRHFDIYGFVKVMTKHPFDNDLYVWWYDDDGHYRDCNLEDYEANVYNQLNRRVNGGLGLRIWF